MHLAAMYGQAPILQQLAEARANIFPLDLECHTPLHLAVQQYLTETITTLEALGGSPDPRDLGSWSPFPANAADLLAGVLRQAITTAAAAEPGNPDKQRGAAFVSSAAFLPVLQMMLGKRGAVDVKQHTGLTIAQLAAITGSTQILEVLILAGELSIPLHLLFTRHFCLWLI